MWVILQVLELPESIQDESESQAGAVTIRGPMPVNSTLQAALFWYYCSTRSISHDAHMCLTLDNKKYFLVL